ncbi:MAG: hypothetical protein CMN67_00915 [Sphingomonadaceae bacterium]|nr:hypothetical protein [Sphingomonadaceae bacterium]
MRCITDLFVKSRMLPNIHKYTEISLLGRTPALHVYDKTMFGADQSNAYHGPCVGRNKARLI